MAGGLSSDSWSDYSVHGHPCSLLLQAYSSPEPAAMSHDMCEGGFTQMLYKQQCMARMMYADGH